MHVWFYDTATQFRSQGDEQRGLSWLTSDGCYEQVMVVVTKLLLKINNAKLKYQVSIVYRYIIKRYFQVLFIVYPETFLNDLGIANLSGNIAVLFLNIGKKTLFFYTGFIKVSFINNIVWNVRNYITCTLFKRIIIFRS